MSTNARTALIAAGVVVLVIGGFVIASSSSSGPKTQVGTADIVVAGGKPKGGVKTINVRAGSQASLRVSSDVTDEVHVHGYDLKMDVGPGHPVLFSFPATLPGRFDIELERRGEQIAALQVQ